MVFWRNEDAVPKLFGFREVLSLVIEVDKVPAVCSCTSEKFTLVAFTAVFVNKHPTTEKTLAICSFLSLTYHGWLAVLKCFEVKSVLLLQFLITTAIIQEKKP